MLLAADPQVAVAVLDFEASPPELAPLGRGLAQMLVTDLSVSESVQLVERARLRDVLAELELQRSRWSDPKTAAAVGRGVGAELICTGQLVAAGGRLRIDLRTIDVASGAIVFTAKVEGEAAGLLDLQRRLATETLRGLGARLSPIGGKQIGKRGTNDRRALIALGEALGAEDAGQLEALRDRLAAALAADPSFGAARDRLAALEERVTTLEQSGGLIQSPRSWREHLHNFDLHRRRAELLPAERSLASAIAAQGSRAELWSRALELPLEARRRLTSGSALDPASKAALEAYLSLDLGALRDAAPSPKLPAFRPVLVVDLVVRRLPAFSVTAAIELERALLLVLAPDQRALVEGMLIDAQAFFADAVEARRQRFEGRTPAGKLLERLLVSPDRGHEGSSSGWELHLRLAERPATPIAITIDRIPLPPGEQPYPNDGLWQSDLRGDRPAPDARDAALNSGSAFGWYVNEGSDPFAGRGLRGHQPFGGTFEVPQTEPYLECEPASTAPTGVRCGAWLSLSKISMPPGPYAVRVVYRDAAGAVVRYHDPRLWFTEWTLAGFRSGLWRHSDPEFTINPIDDSIRERLHPKDRADRGLVMAARACANPPLSSAKPSPLAGARYDLDHRLRGGRPVEERDLAAWRAYRDQILARGRRADPIGDDGCLYLPLPKLAPGSHVLCLVALRSNGSRSLEPECFPAEVPARYPQEGRTRE
jgi:TolB-like protein